MMDSRVPAKRKVALLPHTVGGAVGRGTFEEGWACRHKWASTHSLMQCLHCHPQSNVPLSVTPMDSFLATKHKQAYAIKNQTDYVETCSYFHGVTVFIRAVSSNLSP